MSHSGVPEWLSYVARPETLVFIIPIVAIVMVGIVTVTKLLIRHRERMAMIERGMHPDQAQEQGGPQNRP